MNEVVEQFLAERATLSLPKTARTRSGVEFAPDEAKWCFRDGIQQVSLNFESLPDACASLLPGLKRTLLWYFENRAPKTACSKFSDFRWFVQFLANRVEGAIESIRPEDIVVIRLSEQKAEHRLAALRAFLIRWNQLGAPGVGSDVAYVLSRQPLKQSPLGVAVETLDPRKGPFTDFEFQAIMAALNNAYARDEIVIEFLLLCHLMMSLGSRPVQLASLKCVDLIVPKEPDGDYVLKVPRAKQRGLLVRSQFKWRKLSPQIGRPLAAHVEMIEAEFADRLQDPRQAPLFPQRRMVEDAYSPGFEYHLTPELLSKRVTDVFAKLSVPSERMQGAIPIIPTRFRRTFATRAAEEGWSLLVIAELMDHMNTKHVQVYTGLTSHVRAQFSRKIAMEMAPLAMAFTGKIIRSEGEATRPGSASRIVDLRVDRSGACMGSCGSHAYCGFARPVACYAGCYDFEPWLDGPHEAVLDYMLTRRAHLMATTDARIATINDRAILGCTQVILRCRQILAEGNHD